jgi:hypothetical protein
VKEEGASDSAESNEDAVVEGGFAIMPPAGFVRISTDKPSAKRASWQRTRAGTGGIELLTVSRTGTRLDKPTGHLLAQIAQAITQSSVPLGATSVQVSARALAGKPGQAQAETYRAHVEGTSRQHSLFRWFTDENNEVVMVAIGASQSIRMEQLDQDAAAVVDSFRYLVAQKKQPIPNRRKWWQVFR